LRPYTVAGGTFDPVEELGEAIDLVVVLAVGKSKHLGAELIEPTGSRGQVNLTGFDAR
jgi:hypothetical protein